MRCKHLKALFKYVLCGIYVAVMFRSAIRTCPSAYRQVSDLAIYLPAAIAPLAGRICPWHPYEHTSVISHLVFELSVEA